MDETVIYITPAYKVGNTFWRMMVYERDWQGKPDRFTRYQFQDPRGNWTDEKKHPRYDSHDQFYGLPKGLRTIYYRHQAEIQNALRPEPAPEPEYPVVWTPEGMQTTFTAPDEPIQPNLF